MITVCAGCKSEFEADPNAPLLLCARCSSAPAFTPTLRATPVSEPSDPLLTPTVISPAPAGERPADLPPGPPQYQILEYLARGGMGFVLKARDRRLERVVALKMPLPALAVDPEFRDRFLREARSAASLRHSNICPIYEVGEHAGSPYIAMAFIEGATLHEWARKNKPSARRAAEILAVLSRAVAYAHQHGVIHRDLKPQNVILERETSQPVLMDFGLARETKSDSRVTLAGQVVGTPAYMPPEQAAGQIENVGPHSDLYSLGAILYEFLTGRPPFQGTVGEVIHRVQHEEPPAPRKLVPSLHRDIETVCLKAMAKNPAERYADAEAFARDLDAFAAGESIQARRAGPIARVVRSVRRSPRAAAVIAVAVLVGAGTAGLFLRATSTTRRIAELRQQIDAGGRGGIPTPAAMPLLDGKCAELEALDAASGRTAREDVTRAIAAEIRRLLRLPRMESADIESVKRGLELLESRGEKSFRELREEHLRRLAMWETVFELARPYDRLGEIFDKGALAVDPAGLRGGPAMKNLSVGPVRPTRHPASGNVELQARFAKWRNAPVVGLGFAAATGRGYAFTLRPSVAPAGSTPVVAALQIWRGNALLVETSLDLEQLPGDEIAFHVLREGNLVSVQVGGMPKVEFEDVFSVRSGAPGTFEVVLSDPARLTYLRAGRQAMPPAASPLERGDDLFDQGRHEEALGSYREQAIQATGGPFALEARYKEGLCLAALGRKDEALPLFTEVGSQEGLRWPLLAMCQVWLAKLEKGQLAEAQLLLQNIELRFDARLLAAGIPEELRSRIVNAYGFRSAGINLLSGEPGRRERLEGAIQVIDLLKPNDHDRIFVRWNLMRHYELEDDLEAAERQARETLLITVQGKPGGGWRIPLVEELAWIQRLRGRKADALSTINAALLDAGGRPHPWAVGLLVERARIHAAGERTEAAKADIDLFLKSAPLKEIVYRHWGGAHLLRAFMAEREGDTAAKQEALRLATLERWQEATGHEGNVVSSGTEQLFMLTAAALTETMSKRHLDQLLGFLVRSEPGASGPQDMARSMLNLTPEGMGEIMRSPRGVAYARDAAFLRIPFGELIEGPACLLAHRILGGGRARKLTSEEDEMAWETSRQWTASYRKSKVNFGQLVQLGMAYRGSMDLFGWGGLAPKLAPDLRGPIAYFLAFQYEELKRPVDAAKLWRQAHKDAPEGSGLRRLAAQELKRVGQEP